jgi:DNA-binding NtrC family response regulator
VVTGAPLRVLIVEDEPRYRALLVTMLRGLGCEPDAVASAVEAMSRLGTENPDVVLLDLNLPGMSGMTFLERFRRRHAATPVVILTGDGSLESAQSAIRHRVTEYLTKPCHLGDLEAAIGRARRDLAAVPHAPVTAPLTGPPRDPGASAPPTMSEIERAAILAALARHGGRRAAAARDLGISRRTLQYRLAEYRRATG